MVQRNIVDGPMTRSAKRSINCAESTFCSELISSFSGLRFVNRMIWPTIPTNAKQVLRKDPRTRLAVSLSGTLHMDCFLIVKHET